LTAEALHPVKEQMMIGADNIFLSLSVLAVFLFLILRGRAKGQRVKLLLGGMGVAAAIVALALLGDRLLGPS
jgi:hypothetical protein